MSALRKASNCRHRGVWRRSEGLKPSERQKINIYIHAAFRGSPSWFTFFWMCIKISCASLAQRCCLKRTDLPQACENTQAHEHLCNHRSCWQFQGKGRSPGGRAGVHRWSSVCVSLLVCLFLCHRWTPSHRFIRHTPCSYKISMRVSTRRIVFYGDIKAYLSINLWIHLSTSSVADDDI